MIVQEDHDSIVELIRQSPRAGSELRAEAMRILSMLPEYRWSGVYRLEGDVLVLDSYVGAETDHTVIPVGRGVCGTAVSEDRNQVVQDVRSIENYLACSVETRSEIVVLIRRDGIVLGQIDIDGHTVGAFDSSDEALLMDVADLLAARW